MLSESANPLMAAAVSQGSLLPYLVVGMMGLALLIFVHELGHFLAAKLIGVKVLEFVIGFGPKIVAIKRGDTTYGIAPLLIGAYVKMEGELSLVPEQEATGFEAEPVLRRAFVIACGPLFNWLMTVLLITVLLAVVGMPSLVPSTTIAQVLPKTAAAHAGLKVGDRIESVAGLRSRNWETLSRTIKRHPGERVELVVVRQHRAVRLIAQLGRRSGRGFLGVAPGGRTVYDRMSILTALYRGPVTAVRATWFMATTIYDLIKQNLFLEQLRSPIGAVVVSAQTARDSMFNFWILLAEFSTMLAVVNLFPIPPFDGGRLLFLAIEAVRRRPLNPRALLAAQAVGVALVLALFAYVLTGDVQRYLLPALIRGVHLR